MFDPNNEASSGKELVSAVRTTTMEGSAFASCNLEHTQTHEAPVDAPYFGLAVKVDLRPSASQIVRNSLSIPSSGGRWCR